MGSKLTHLPLIVCAVILLIHLPPGQEAPLGTTPDLEFQGPLAISTEVRVKRLSPLLLGIAWIFGTNFAAGLARATHPAHQQLHETRFCSENNSANSNHREILPEVLPAPVPLLDRSEQSTAEEKALEVPQRLIPLNNVGWTILSFLNPIGAFLNLVPKLHGAEGPTRVEREAPVEDAKTFRDSKTTGVLDVSNFMDFYESLQALRHQLGLDSNLTSVQDVTPEANVTQTLEFTLHVLPTVPRTTAFVNFLYLWLIIMIVGIVIYENAPQYLKKIPGSIKRSQGPLTKGKDMKQDLTSAV